MRRLAPALLAALCACAAPRPCTQALCPSRVDGEYRVIGWNRAVTAGADGPAVPVVSDSDVEVLRGTVEFVNRRAVVRAEAGAAFRFAVSTSAPHAASIYVSTGSVSVALSSAAPSAAVPPGATYPLPAR